MKATLKPTGGFASLSVVLLSLALAASGCGKHEKEEAVPFDESLLVADEDVIETARDEVRNVLKGMGVDLGYDSHYGLVTAMATVSQAVSDPSSNGSFARIRSACLVKALEQARHSLLTTIAIDTDIDIGSEIERALGAPNAPSDDGSISRSISGTLAGATVVASSESWLNGKYEVAVAAVFSKKLMSEMTDRLAGKAKENGMPGKQTLQEWLDGLDCSLMQGPRSFLDSDGVRHYLGFGAADADSPAAPSIARAEATKFALFSFPARITASQTFNKDGKVEDKYSEVLETAPRATRDVFSTEIVHPISGRKMAVVVVEAIP